MKVLTMALVDVKTEIAGTVSKILVSVGDRVEEDDPILILESMKMEIPVSAPEGGIVKEIRVQEGQVVTDATVVATLDA
jgi:acetyl-CoA carboxylase biotin carboxyl carrier protein